MIFAPILLLSSVLSAVSAAPSLQLVTVGKDGALQYSPDTITAAVGSQVEFQFYGPVHTVVQASFDEPCTAFDDGTGFYASFTTKGDGPNPTTFTLTVNDTKPIWFYCAFPGHCQAGMVGVINQSSSNKSQTLDNFKSQAANVGKSTTPKQQQGGKFGAFVDPSSASTTTSSSSSGSTQSSSSPKPTKSGNEAGRMKGELALLGGVAVAVAALLV
ncbi:Cupredoxin [Trichoderma barbatum]